VRGKAQHWIAIGIAALPIIALVVEFATNGLGANPIEEITHVTGERGLRLILISLAITPARRFQNLRNVAPMRRTLGLAGFAYACLHLTTWAILDLGLDTSAIIEDPPRRSESLLGCEPCKR
jgi:sulfoxide reductase heme-binding subunit YedZ